MIIQIGTEADESRILWKHSESDEWQRADIDDLIDAYESRPTGEWVKALDGYERHVKCTHCFKTYDWHSEAKHYNYCPNCGARIFKGGDSDG